MKSLFSFFSKWTAYGIILILCGIIISLKSENTPYHLLNTVLYIVSNLLTTLGIGLIMGSIFDFTKNTESFMNFMSKLLSDVVVSKSFLNKLEEKGKKEALSLILQPTNNQLEQYSNIELYFKEQIDRTMKMFSTNFYSHYNLNLTVYKDASSGKIMAKSVRSHRIYKIYDKYEPLENIYTKGYMKIIKRKIIYPGECKEITYDKSNLDSNLKYEEKKRKGKITEQWSYTIPEELNEYPYLFTEVEALHTGEDYWISYRWSDVSPHDGTNITLTWELGLELKKYHIFGDSGLLNVERSEDGQSMRIFSTQWIQNYGFVVIIAEKNQTSVTEPELSVTDEGTEDECEE